MEVEIKYQKNVDYFGLSSDITENQSCACGHCVRGEGLCHCLGNGPEFDAHRCACLGIACNHKIARVGSSMSSAIGGISHGVVDFVVGSLHDLQTAAVYIGSGELEMTLHERAAMIEAVEQSQMQQLATLGSHFMDMLSIDGSDASYQSFRSNTRLGLEVGSLVAGGYGAIKGVIAFTRRSAQVAKIAKAISRIPSNPLQGTKYSKKVLLQMENNLKTGKPDFHGFPRIVDNYANFGQKELIRGKDGLFRTKISLEGRYKGRDGYFEWIIETDKSVNHRIFIHNP